MTINDNDDDVKKNHKYQNHSMCWETVPGFFVFLIYIIFSKIMSDLLLYLLSLPHLALTSKRFVKWVEE